MSNEHGTVEICIYVVTLLVSLFWVIDNFI